MSTNVEGGSLETAEDIDAVLDAIPLTLFVTVPPGGAPVIPLSGSIRLPNGSVPLGDVFYTATISPGDVNFDEPVEDVCSPAPIPSGDTCTFADGIPAFPGEFTLDFTFTDGAGVGYTSTRSVTLI
ncbi:MAG: hypothetical protein AAF704_13860 [Cyanobacteria bacterium P01_D01_bin.123]